MPSKAIVLAIIMIESSGNPLAKSPTGAKSLMQLTSIGEKEVCVQYGCDLNYNPWDPQTNILMGSQLLAFYLKQAKGNKIGMAILYSAGYNTYYSWLKGEELPTETVQYIAKFKHWERYYDTLVYRLPEELPRYYDLVDDATSDNLFDSASLLVGPPRY